MFKADEKTFMTVFLSKKDIETSVYTSDNVVYRWEFYDKRKNGIIDYYLMSPATYSKYKEFLETVRVKYPLLLELV